MPTHTFRVISATSMRNGQGASLLMTPGMLGALALKLLLRLSSLGGANSASTIVPCMTCSQQWDWAWLCTRLPCPFFQHSTCKTGTVRRIYQGPIQTGCVCVHFCSFKATGE